MNIKLPDLQVAIIEITKECPNRCVGCYYYQRNKKEKREMKLDEFKKVIDKLSEVETFERIQLSGGEPFMHKNIIEMAEYTYKKITKPIIFTSGIMPDKKMIEKLKPFVESFNVTMKYPNELDNDFKGNEDAFKNACDFLQICKYLKIKTRIHYVVDRDFKFIFNGKLIKSNYFYFDEMYSLAEKYDSELILLRFIPFEKNFEGRFLSRNKWDSLCEYALEHPRIKISNITKHTNYKCTAGLTRLSISVDGFYTPCIYLGAVIGNIFSENINRIRDKLIKWRLNFKKMNRCIAMGDKI